MKKFAKKLVALTTLSALMSLALVGCAKRTECEGCEEKKKCYEYEASFMGETESGWFCDDCAEEMESYIKAFGGDWEKK
ncbi:MAG: hypothetical protein J6A25_13725 [Lachnospiraceae bacterium]|nr:hypothetical protein [Lachnospiraceae bacterium]